MGVLEGMHVAVVMADGVEEAEFRTPANAMTLEGADNDVLSLDGGTVQSYRNGERAERFGADQRIRDANPDDYEAVLLPGGIRCADTLRVAPDALNFVAAMTRRGMPIAAIGHAAWVLIEAGVAPGRTLTSAPSIATDVRNAGGEWLDQVVADDTLVTARGAVDFEIFCKRMIATFGARPGTFDLGGRAGAVRGRGMRPVR